jgi:hypothetical protein
MMSGHIPFLLLLLVLTPTVTRGSERNQEEELKVVLSEQEANDEVTRLIREEFDGETDPDVLSYSFSGMILSRRILSILFRIHGSEKNLKSVSIECFLSSECFSDTLTSNSLIMLILFFLFPSPSTKLIQFLYSCLDTMLSCETKSQQNLEEFFLKVGSQIKFRIVQLTITLGRRLIRSEALLSFVIRNTCKVLRSQEESEAGEQNLPSVCDGVSYLYSPSLFFIFRESKVCRNVHRDEFAITKSRHPIFSYIVLSHCFMNF